MGQTPERPQGYDPWFAANACRGEHAPCNVISTRWF
jgi:hypothetical protein